VVKFTVDIEGWGCLDVSMSEDMMDQRDLIHYGLEQDYRDDEEAGHFLGTGATLEYLQQFHGARPLSHIYAEQRYDEMDREWRERQLEKIREPLPEGYDWGDRLLTDEERETRCLENLIEEVSARVEELYDDYYFDEEKLIGLQKELDAANIHWDTIREITKSDILFTDDWNYWAGR